MNATKRFLTTASVLGVLAFPSASTLATESRGWLPAPGSHTWDFSEVFSDPTGDVQFIELLECCGCAAETGLPGRTLTSNSNTWVIPGAALTAPTSNKRYLIATPDFAALAGAPTPDAIVPAGMVPFFSTAGDTLNYVPWDTWVFGAVPTNGTDSLERDGTVGANSPTNYAGTTGSVTVTPPGGPVGSPLWLVALGVAFVLLASLLLGRHSRRPAPR